MTTPQTVLNDVLDIVDFKGDKKEFISEFLALAIQETVAGLIDKLTEDKQSEVEKIIQLEQNQVIKKLSEYFNKEEFESSLNTSIASLFENYLKEIKPTLSPPQLQQLESYFS